MLIGGLGLGYALDEALDLERAEVVTVAEFEPCILSWFEQYGGERARRAAADGRARILIADVYDVLREASCEYDLICLDTDNGPRWLVREPNAALYDERGIALVSSASEAERRGGLLVAGALF